MTAIRNMAIKPILVFFLKNVNSFLESGFSNVSRGQIKNIIIADTSVIQIKTLPKLYKAKNLIKAIEENINRVDNISHRVSVVA